MLAPPDSPLLPERTAPPLLAWAIAALLVASLALIVAGLRGPSAGPGRAAQPPHAAAATIPAVAGPPPAVAPITYAAMTPDEARADNRARAFAGEKPMAARPFLFAGSDADRAAARTCLAAAVLYEAGDDATGEQAVAQVVLNRLRHPAFPKTVCGVIFQGADRATGCQFTFACDGSLGRPPQEAAWGRARRIADAALSGHVDKAVGPATHYHADYVVPYWRDSLTKLVSVGAHIFYRWPGVWGSNAALTGRLQPFEPLDRRLVALAGPEAVGAANFADLDIDGPPGSAPAAPPLVALAIDGVPRAALKGAIVRAKDEAVAQYALQFEGGSFPGSWAVTGFSICAEHPDCIVLGWTSEEQTPRALPVGPAEMRTLAFMYRKSTALGIARPSWDCRRFQRPARDQCLPGTAPAPRAALSAPRLAPEIALPAPPAPVAAIRPPPAPASH